MGPLLETKLHVPRGSPQVSDQRIVRPELTDRLGRAGAASLTVISAPAGFGKTTAVTEWVESLSLDPQRVAWLSLDDRDNDPVMFWTYVLAALRTALGIEFGLDSSGMLQSGQANTDAVVATLLNELLSDDRDVVLVLDDYHVISTPAIHDGVTMLVEHLPPRTRVIIASRADPPLPLGRLRVGGRLVEIRAADLRFTAEETATYLQRASGTTLSTGDVVALAERTEGWVAALQLAALSMRGREDVSSFITEFAGDDRYIVDYLAEEVLDRQTEGVRQFLLQTSILDRLTGPLCDAVTARPGGKSTLEQLERANLFLVPLDDRRQWYRYHHLFAEVLQAHLADEQPDAVAELHRRASAWHASDGEMTEGIRHALAAGDAASAADLVEEALPAWRQDRREITLRTWLDRLPADVVRERPLLIVGRVGALAALGEFEDDTEAQLDAAERMINQDNVIGDAVQLRSLPATIEAFRAALALIRGDLDGTQFHGGRAIELSLDDDHLERAAAAGLVGLASWACGDIARAIDGFAMSIAGLLRADHITDVLGISVSLAELRLAQGQLREAARIYTDGLTLATSQGRAPLRGTADMHVGLSEIHREFGEFDAAQDHLRRSVELGDHNGLPQNRYRSRLVMARLRAAEGDIATARELLDEADRFYATDFSPAIRPVAAVRAGMLADHGTLAEPLAWVRERRLAADDEPDYVGEFEHVTLARVLLAQFRANPTHGSVEEAIRLLERVSVSAEAAGRFGDLLRMLVLLALAEDARGERSAGIAHLERALTLAEPEGYMRLFLDEGPGIRPLLQAVVERGPSAEYASRILEATTASPPQPGARQPLVDPLSDRELDVLRLLASELTGPEIARELMVSVNTMRTHTKNIYSKLGVTSRRAAVRHADELRLLARRSRD